MTTPYDAEIAQLEADLKRLHNELGILNQRKADFLCPYEIGQVMVDERSKRAKITNISLDWGGNYRLTAHYVLKDGTIGKQPHRLYNFGGWKPEKTKDEG